MMFAATAVAASRVSVVGAPVALAKSWQGTRRTRGQPICRTVGSKITGRRGERQDDWPPSGQVNGGRGFEWRTRDQPISRANEDFAKDEDFA